MSIASSRIHGPTRTSADEVRTSLRIGQLPRALLGLQGISIVIVPLVSVAAVGGPPLTSNSARFGDPVAAIWIGLVITVVVTTYIWRFDGIHLVSLGIYLKAVVVMATAFVTMISMVAIAPAAHASAAVPGVSASVDPAGGFVTRSGQQLLLNGAQYRFTGINIYNANSVNNYWYTMGTGSALDAALTAAGPGKNVFRAWFGQWLANPAGAGLDFSVFDHTLAVARAHGYKVIVTLADQEGTWDDGINKTLDSGWYQGGYRTAVSTAASSWGARNTLTYRDFVLRVVDRYRNDPTVLMWQLVNEAETKKADGSCSEATSDAGAVAVRGFADDMSRSIKAVDGNHLVSLGTIGTGQCGTSGSRFLDVHSPVGIDLTEMHDYVAGQAIIGDQWNGMALRLAQSKQLNKPLFVGELGVDPTAVGGVNARARIVKDKLTAQFAAGVVGVVAWEWRNPGQSGGDPYVIDAGDPELSSLQLSQYVSLPSPAAGGWKLNGSSTVVGGAVQLTAAIANNAAGSVFYPTPLYSKDLRVSFDATMGGGGGADGLTLALADPAAGATPASVGVAGGGLGWSGIGGSAVALDTYRNGSDPSSNFVGVATGRQSTHPDNLTWAATSVAVPSLRTGTHHVAAAVVNGVLSVSIDDLPVLSAAIALPPVVLVGFTAGSGGLTDQHLVSAVSVFGGAAS